MIALTELVLRVRLYLLLCERTGDDRLREPPSMAWIFSISGTISKLPARSHSVCSFSLTLTSPNIKGKTSQSHFVSRNSLMSQYPLPLLQAGQEKRAEQGSREGSKVSTILKEPSAHWE